MGHGKNSFETPPRVFISYARSDGEAFASSLRSKLERKHPEITLWFDRAQMLGGIGWWKQITEALDKVEILVMALTPAAMQSGIAAKEWRYARQQGVRVCPVMEQGSTLDFEALPSWMRKVHCYDLDREWKTFVEFLQSPGKNNRVPFMAPDIPDNDIVRPVLFGALLSRLLDESGENPQFVTTALQGSGGFGKTTLASMVCHDENIISAFDDGILWVRLGETPNIQGELTKLYAALTGERPPFIDIDDVSIQLAERLEQKNCLLVVDDVWDPNHLRPFMRGGTQCARLVTTRKVSVVTEAETTRTVVEKMTEDQAVRLLSQRITFSHKDLGPLRALAAKLGGWPLLLKLVGSQIRARSERGDSVEGALAYIDKAIHSKGVIFPKEREEAIARTVGASLNLFSSEDQKRCAELAVFRNDILIPLAAASALWGLDAFDTEDLILRFDDAALLKFDLKTGRIRIHNVLRSYFESQLGGTRELHARLVGKWLLTPYDLPDSYAWTWIGWHLAQAGEHGRLQRLLLDFDWLRARLRLIPIQVVLQDFEFLGGSDDPSIVRDALRLASHGLSFDPGQLRVQLVGRTNRGRSQSVDELLDKADESETGPRLVLASSSLTHPGGALTGILKSHSSAVVALAVSPDGRWLVSGSEDWTLRLWDLQTNRVVRTFEGHDGTIHTVTFTNDGQSILSGSEDRTLRLWDVNTAEVKHVFRGHALAVQGVAITVDGQVAATVSEDGSVRAWFLKSKKTKTIFKGHNHQLNAITTNGDKWVFGAGDWTIRLIDHNNGAEKTFKGHSGIVRTLAITPDGTKLLSGAQDGAIRVWALDTGEPLLELLGHRGPVDSIAVTPDGKRVVSGSHDKTLRVWNLETGEALQVLEGHSGFVRSIAISPATSQIVSGSSDRTIRQWNIESAPTDQPPSGHAEAVALLSLSADGNRAISGTQAGDLVVWDVDAHDKRNDDVALDRYAVAPCVIEQLDGHTDRIHSLQMTADGERAVTGSRDRTVRVWGVKQAVSTQVLTGHTREIRNLDISADGMQIVSLSSDRTLRVWNSETGKCIRVLVSKENARALYSLQVDDAMLAELEIGPEVDIVNKPIPRDACIALSPDGNRVVVGSPGNIGVWNLRTGSMQNKKLIDLIIVSIAFDANSEKVVLGTLFGPLVVWELEQEPSVLNGHVGKVLDVVVSPDGKSVMSAASDDTIRIWDLDSYTQRAQLTGHDEKVDAVVIAPNGNLAYSIYGDTLVAYDLNAAARLASLSFDHLITTIAVTPSGKRIAIGDRSGQVHFLCLQS